MSNRKQQALDLELKIQALIESGEFTPELGYRGMMFRVGPCGCALSAAAYSANDKNEHSHADEMRGHLQSMGYEFRDILALEWGYEGWKWTYQGPFYELGKRLRAFHPSI